MYTEAQIKSVAEHWGDMMPMMAMEEAAEFAQAVSKLERYRRKIDDVSSIDLDPDDFEAYLKARKNLIDEIGDMFISLGAIMTTFYIPGSAVDERIEYKLSKRY